MHNKKAVILMAVCNGARFIEDQVKSLLNQTYRDWVLIVSDDASDDETVQILMRYKQIDNRIKKVIVQRTRQGAYKNYFSLMYYVKKNYKDSFDYYFYCDQDDIWLPEKMEKEIMVLDKAIGKPVLCYTDVEFIDENGIDTNIHASDIRKMEVGNQYDFLFEFRYLLGTCMAHNRELWNIVSIPHKHFCSDLRHDQFVRKYAALCGQLVYIPQALVKYRRHDSNVSSELVDYDFFSAIKKFCMKLPSIISHTAMHFCNTEIFLNLLDKDDSCAVKDFKNAVLYNGAPAVHFIKKYEIEISDNIYERIMYEILFITGLYKFTHRYRVYKRMNKFI